MSIDYLNGCCSVNRNGYSVYDFNHNTVQQLLCEFFTKINECVDSSNKALEFMEWVKEEGLPVEVVKYINQMLEDGTLADLINKTIFEELNLRLDNIQNEINSLNSFPLIIPEPNDYNRLIRAINATKKGGILKIPVGTYDLGGNNLILDKAITLQGDGLSNTIITNTIVKINTSNVTINDITVNTTLANAFQCNEKTVSNIRINRCQGIARDHSFLFESYSGNVQNVICYDCISNGSIHGFISKAYDIHFINCKANNHVGGFGFGMISDNIPSSDSIANATYNSVENCTAYNCSSGVRSYCRDKYNATCQPRCNNNVIDNFIASTCMYPVSIGEDTTPSDYLSIYQIEYTKIENVRDILTGQNVYSVKLAKTSRCIVDNCSTLYGVYQTENARDNIIGNNNLQTLIQPNTSVIALTSDLQKIDVGTNNVVEIMLNSSTPDGAKFVISGSPKNGSIVTLLIRNAGKGSYGGIDTTNLIVDTAKFDILKTGITFNYGQVIQLMWMRGASKWLIISASGLINLS